MVTRINAPELVKKLVSRYGIVGAQGPDTLGPEIVPVTIVDELISEKQPDDVPFASGIVRTAAAGEYAAAGLGNPSSRDVLCLLDKITVWTDTSLQLKAGWFATKVTGGNVAVNYSLDRRRGDQKSSCIVYHQSRASSTTDDVIVAGTLANQLSTFDNLGIVIPPGYQFDMQSGSIVITVNFCFYWRERPIRRTD